MTAAAEEEQHAKEKCRFKGEKFIIGKQLMYKWETAQKEPTFSLDDCCAFLLSATNVARPVPICNTVVFSFTMVFQLSFPRASLFFAGELMYMVAGWGFNIQIGVHIRMGCAIYPWMTFCASASFCVRDQVTYLKHKNCTWLKGIFWVPWAEMPDEGCFHALVRKIELETNLTINGIVGPVTDLTEQHKGLTCLRSKSSSVLWVQMPANASGSPLVYVKPDANWEMQDVCLITAFSSVLLLDHVVFHF